MACDDYCCNHGCNQGRDCPARAKPICRTDPGIEGAITKLREAVAKAQTEGFNLDLHLGRSRAYATAHAAAWGVSVKAGDLLRILDALEKTK